MKIEALTGFCGALCMAKGEVRECADENVLADLLSAGYVKERAEPKKKTKTTAKRGVKKDEG